MVLFVDKQIIYKQEQKLWVLINLIISQNCFGI